MASPTCDNFNQLAIEFLTSMSKLYPQEEKIQEYIVKYNLVKTFYSQKPVEMFMESMYSHGEQILTENEDFFKGSEYVNKAESISGKIGLIKYWDTMPKSTKDVIWEYMKALFILGMGVLGKKQELQDLINKIGGINY